MNTMSSESTADSWMSREAIIREFGVDITTCGSMYRGADDIDFDASAAALEPRAPARGGDVSAAFALARQSLAALVADRDSDGEVRSRLFQRLLSGSAARTSPFAL